MGSSAPKTPQYSPAEMIDAEARANRTNTRTPFGSTIWSNNGGQWSQDVSVSPELQGVLDRVFGMAGQAPGQFESGGIQGSMWEGPAQGAAQHMGNRKQRAQSMDYRPPQGQGLYREGSFQGGNPLAPGRFFASEGLSAPDNQQSAMDAAALFQQLVPKPPEYDPMRYSDAYDQLFGGRLSDFDSYWRNR